MVATTIAVSGPTSDELVARAKALASDFRARSEADPTRRRLPDENVTDLRAAGLFQVLQARRNGGLELDLATHLDVVGAVAEGCPSTAWVLGVAHAHSWMLSHFPAEAQDDVYAAEPDALVSAVIRPRGTAVRVAGGFRLSGFWPFGSGAEHAQWVMVGAELADQSGAKYDEADLLLPRSDVTLADDWYVEGLKATGSCSIVLDDVFVPEHRVLSLVGMHTGDTPGQGLHGDGWLHRAAATPVLTIALTGAAIGAARAALADFIELVGTKTVPYVPHGEGPPGSAGDKPQGEWALTHRTLGDAAIRIEEGQLLLERSARTIDAQGRSGEPMPYGERGRVRMDCAQGVRRCLEAVELLYLATGGSGLRSSNRIGQNLRDLQAMNMHALLGIDMNREMYGRVLLGLDAPLV